MARTYHPDDKRKSPTIRKKRTVQKSKNMNDKKQGQPQVAIVIGHTEKKPGACSPHGIPCEWQFNNKVAEYLKDIADVYYNDTYKRGYRSMVARTAKRINKEDYLLVIELHYNAASPSANGTECLYYYANETGKKLAQLYSKMVSDKFGTKIRGNKGAKALVNKGDRGFYAVAYPDPTAIMPEPFFGSNKEDAKRFKGKEKQYSELLRAFIAKAIRILKKK